MIIFKSVFNSIAWVDVFSKKFQKMYPPTAVRPLFLKNFFVHK